MACKSTQVIGQIARRYMVTCIAFSMGGRRSALRLHDPFNTSSTPCAACKLLRRRCVQDCPFSPYFSPYEPQKFACVHKVFGASNVSKMLLEVPENQRADVASSLVFEANARLRDPVYGCMGTISVLQQQSQGLQAELNAVRTEILRFKLARAAAAALPTASNSSDERSFLNPILTENTFSSRSTVSSQYTVGFTLPQFTQTNVSGQC